MRSISLAVFKLMLLGVIAARASAGDPGSFPVPAPRYEVRLEKSAMVPMRDGVRLSTDIYLPQGAGERLPVILIRTPYNKNEMRQPGFAYTMPRSLWPTYLFTSQGYAVVVQDIRGKYESEGRFVFLGGDAEDGFDTAEWIARQPWSNGKIGSYGCSYLGEVQYQQATQGNPHLAAMIPQAAGGASRYRAGGVVNGGALELASMIGWLRVHGSKLNLQAPPGTSEEELQRSAEFFRPQPQLPEVDFFKLSSGLPVIEILRNAGGPPTDYEEIVRAGPPPTNLNGIETPGAKADAWWDKTGFLAGSERFDVPALHVNSWYDWGVGETLKMRNLMIANSSSARGRDNQFAIISPTTHCMSEVATQRTVVGERDVGDASINLFDIYLRWFKHWLKGVDNGVTSMPKLQIYVMGRNQWRGENEWPLARTRFTKYFLHSGGAANSRVGDGLLDPAVPRDGHPDTLVYDPQTPVPTTGGLAPNGSWQVLDGGLAQAHVEMRHDVLVYSSPPLREGVEVTGPIEVVLYASSSARDTDFVAKLVDVFPDGRAYNLQEGILRARYREGFDRKVWMKPDGVYEIRIDLQATSNYFAPGHRIRLEVSSSNFPRFDRNLNTGGNNYDESTWVVARNVIHHSAQYPSHVVLPVIPP